MRSGSSLWIAVVALVAAMLPATPAQQPPRTAGVPAERADGGPLVVKGQAPDLAFIYSGGVVGYVDPCG